MCLDAFRCPRRSAAQPTAEEFFELMSQRLAEQGGLITESALRDRWRQHGRQSQDLDDLLAGDRLRSLTWRSQRWLPAFQFRPDGLTPRADVAAIAEELAGGMDAAEILAWFACRNASLDGQTPIDR